MGVITEFITYGFSTKVTCEWCNSIAGKHTGIIRIKHCAVHPFWMSVIYYTAKQKHATIPRSIHWIKLNIFIYIET